MPLQTVISPAWAAPWLATARTPAAAIFNHVLILILPIFSLCIDGSVFASFASCQPPAIIGCYRPVGKLCRKLAHHAVEPGLALEPDPWAVGQRQIAAVNSGIVREAAEIAKNAGIGLRPTEPEASGDGERH